MGIRTLRMLLAAGRGMTNAAAAIANTGVAAVAAAALAIVPCYRAWWTIRRMSVRAQLRGMSRLVAVITSKTATYALFSIAVLGVAAQTIHAREYGGFIGERPLLAAFVSSIEEEDVEEVVLGPAAPQKLGFRAASVGGPLEPFVLGQEVQAMSAPTASAIPIAAYALVQPTITDLAASETGRVEIRSYVIEPGDTFSTIAEKFGLATTTILWENKRSVSSILQPGETLRILPTDGVTHVIARGDTLEKIAARYHADAEDILEFNNLVEADALELGDVLVVPGGRPPTIIAPPAPRPAPVVARPSKPLPSVAGKLLWPSAAGYRISQYFTWRHHGLDIAISSGTPIFASDPGVIIYSGWMSGYGYQVTVDHGNGLRTRYAHSSKLLVSKGQTVTRGQIIALVGSTGRSTGPHIHYEVFANGVRVNPFQYLR